MKTIYLLLWIYFDVNYIYLQIHHHHHVDMLCYYKTLTTNMSSNIFNCCLYRAAVDTFVNDFTWTHCASCLFNTAWFIHMLLLIGLTSLTHPPNKRKLSQTPLHTVSSKHVVQPGNRSQTLCTDVNLNVALAKHPLAQSATVDTPQTLAIGCAEAHKYLGWQAFYYYY